MKCQNLKCVDVLHVLVSDVLSVEALWEHKACALATLLQVTGGRIPHDAFVPSLGQVTDPLFR